MGDLTTVDDVKAWLGTKDSVVTGADALLARMVTAASAAIESYLSRIVASASYTETRNGTGVASLTLRNRPITAVASVTVDGVSISAATGPLANGFTFDDQAVYLRGYSFTRGRQNVVIAYTAGFATVPADVADACIQWVGMRYRERDRIGHASKTLNGETVAFDLKDMPANVKTILGQRRNVVPL